jgi:hypothetical protein
MMTTLYDLLGVRSDAEAEAIKTAFRKAVKAHHPDLHPGEPHTLVRFRQIVAANGILSDAKQRAAYDQLLKLERQRRRSQWRPLLIGGLSAVTVFTAMMAVAHWIYAPRPHTAVAAINPVRDAAPAEMLMVQVPDQISKKGQDKGRDDRADVMETAGLVQSAAVATTGSASIIATAALAPGIESGATAAGTNDDRAQLITSTGNTAPAAIRPFATLHPMPATEPRSVATPAVPPTTLAQLATLPPASSSRVLAPQFSGQNLLNPAPTRVAPRHLTIDAVRLRQADEPARLTVSTADAGANAAVVIGGLAPGSALSAGTPTGPDTWRLPAEDFNGMAITPPRGFVGVMDLTLELRLADNTVVDRKGLQLEWLGKTVLAPAKPQPRRLEAAEIALMMKNGAAFMANGNIAAARMMFQAAAEAGAPVAAFALAETYDPLVFGKFGASGGIQPDVALARSWYEKAKNLGSAAALERVERLARLQE